MGEDSILVVIPTRPSDKPEADKNAEVHRRRAGMACTVRVVVDSAKAGWVATHNQEFREGESPFYVYSCGDYFPGRDWLAIAFEIMEHTGAGLVGFNDGKWHGLIATVGLVRREWAEGNYDGDLFYPGYKVHGADDEITACAMRDHKYAYSSEAVLIEVDYEKDLKASDPVDGKLCRDRGYGKYIQQWADEQRTIAEQLKQSV